MAMRSVFRNVPLDDGELKIAVYELDVQVVHFVEAIGKVQGYGRGAFPN
ncbi:hypothetical protein ACFVYT_41625 [Streptomyces sp. NPDC058290]